MSLRSRTDKVAPALDTMQVLVVACGKTYLAIPGAIVRGVVEFGEAVEARIVSLFGESCRVTDLAARLGLAPVLLTPDMRIILCGEQRARQAWRVDRTLGLEDVDMQRITPLPPHFSGVEQSWFTGLFLFRDTVALLINPGWLLSQTMDAFVAQSLLEQAALGESRVLDQAATAPAGDAVMAQPDEQSKPSTARKKGRHKPSVTAGDEAASLEVLENLVLEESADVEDSQTPWADT
ncbi:MAG: chemotaxis protein CheW [Nitrospirae bacterium]|nr:chemotaxis protein CheW [Nitrospirota bacterium]